MEEQKRSVKDIVIYITTVAILLLSIGALGVLLLMTNIDKANEVQIAQDATIAKEQAESDLQARIDSSILTEDFVAKSMQYGVSTEYIQQFFSDELVYKEDGVLKTSPINYELAQHSYNWNLITNPEDKRKTYDDGTTTATLGIDVSKYQGDIEWDKVAADGIDYAIMRLGYRGYGSEGNIVLDEYFHQNMEGAIAAGIPVGVYFFSQAVTPEEGVEEAEFVLSELRNYDLSIPIIIDVEEGGSDTARTNDMTAEQLTDVTIAFCERIKEEGMTPMVYANARWFFSKLQMERLEEYDKWLAQYYRKPFFPYEVDMWQYTNTGAVDGIVGNVDLNLCFTDYFTD